MKFGFELINLTNPIAKNTDFDYKIRDNIDSDISIPVITKLRLQKKRYLENMKRTFF